MVGGLGRVIVAQREVAAGLDLPGKLLYIRRGNGPLPAAALPHEAAPVVDDLAAPIDLHTVHGAGAEARRALQRDRDRSWRRRIPGTAASDDRRDRDREC